VENKYLRREAGREEGKLLSVQSQCLRWQDETVPVLLTLCNSNRYRQKHFCQTSPFSCQLSMFFPLPTCKYQQWTMFQDGLANKVNYKHSYLTLKNNILVVDWIRRVNMSSQVLMWKYASWIRFKQKAPARCPCLSPRGVYTWAAGATVSLRFTTNQLCDRLVYLPRLSFPSFLKC